MTLKKTNHLLHLFLTLWTMGAWGIVWGIVYLKNENHNSMVRQVQAMQDMMGKERDDTEGTVPSPVE